MARFKLELPTNEIKQMETLAKNTDYMLGKMTQAGAKVAAKYMEAGAPNVLKNHVKMTKAYNTPSDGGINTKVYISGYIPFSNPNRSYFSRRGGNGSTYRTSKGVPADFLANIYEHGRSNAPFPKRPFVRKAFKKSEIEAAMLEEQNRIMADLLEGLDDAEKEAYGLT